MNNNKVLNICVWKIRDDRLAIISENSEIQDIIINTKKLPYLNNIVQEAIKFPNKMFRVYIDGNDKSSIIEKILENANDELKKHYIDNLTFKVEFFPSNRFNESYPKDKKYLGHFGHEIDEMKVYAMIDVLNCNDFEGVAFFDFDAIKFHNDSSLSKAYKKNGIALISAKYLKVESSEKILFSPIMMMFSKEKRSFIKDVLYDFKKRKDDYIFESFYNVMLKDICLPYVETCDENLEKMPYLIKLNEDFYKSGMAGGTWYGGFCFSNSQPISYEPKKDIEFKSLSEFAIHQNKGFAFNTSCCMI